jgi:glycosyltransferase involved in cell wall biosynthesis
VRPWYPRCFSFAWVPNVDRPRVAVCITTYEPGGQSVVVEQQVRRLRDSYDFTIVAERTSKANPHVPVVTEKPWLHRYVPVPRSGAHSYLSDFDLVHCHDSFAYIWEATKLGLPVVVTSHGSCPAMFRDTLLLKAEYYAADRIYGLAYRRATRVVAISRYIQSWLLRRYGVTSELCYNGVDLQQFTPAPPSAKQRAFLYAGQLSNRKGVPVLIRAFTKFRKRHPDYRLWLVGFGPMAGELAAQRPPLDGVDYLGFVTAERLAQLFAAACAVVSASYWEGFGLPILEAFAAGTPVVFRRGYSMTELVEGTGGGVLFERDEDLTKALEEVLELGAQPRHLRDVAGFYSWERSAAGIDAVYRDGLRAATSAAV